MKSNIEREKHNMSKTVIGIDLGTGNSCMSIYKNGECVIIPNSEGNRTTPSVVAFTKDGQRLVGQSAKRQEITNPLCTIHSVKRLIGRKYSEVKNIANLVSYKIVENKNKDAAVEINDKIYSPAEISSMVLAKLKSDAEAYLGESVTDAVITVPAYFNDSQRQSTKDAGKIAGFNVLRIINEPTAAALAYGIDKKEHSEIIAVFDIGQGTSDTSILDCGDGVFEVLATNGNALLGGADFDEAIVKHIAAKFNKLNGVDITKDKQALQRLTEAAEKAKCELSTASQTEINIPFISMNQDGPIHLNETLDRSTLERLIGNVFDKFKTPCETCLKDSGKSTSEINEVIMVGGSTRVPYIQNLAKSVFNKEVNKTVNPDEAVAMGAAIQGAVLVGDKSTGDVVLLDVTPLTLSVEIQNGLVANLIDKNTTIPTKKSQIFSTAADMQSEVTIHVIQGEREFAKDNKSLGKFKLDGIAPAPSGVPQIEVSFDIDANGILTVTALDKGTGKSQNITITASSGLTDSEINKMVNEAKSHEKEDKQKKTEIETTNKAESFINVIKKQLTEYSDKIPDSVKSDINKELTSLKTSIDNKDIGSINDKLKNLETKVQEIGKYIYKDNNPENKKADTPDVDKYDTNNIYNGKSEYSGKSDYNKNTNDDDEVVDAEVVE